MTHIFPAGSRCVMTLDLNYDISRASWFDVWQAAVAVDTLCITQGQAGLAYHVGEGDSKLRVILRETGSG